jgi:uncharacterized membrane protein
MLKASEWMDNGALAQDGISKFRQRVTTRRSRSIPDRLRQVALYEIGGVCLISPLLAMLTGGSPDHAAGLLLVLALVMAAWNGIYSTAFDWADRAITGRAATDRPPILRAVHAIMLEAGGAIATTPVIAAWTALTWRLALLEDVGLTLAYSAYGLGFGLIYDSLFPIDSKWTIVEATND